MADQCTVIKVIADYHCFPTWVSSDVGIDDVHPSELGLPDELSAALMAWQEEFDATLNHDDPRASGFANDAAKEDFRARGLGLAREVKARRGTAAVVTYYDGRTCFHVTV
jgi:hypothetical protein